MSPAPALHSLVGCAQPMLLVGSYRLPALDVRSTCPFVRRRTLFRTGPSRRPSVPVSRRPVEPSQCPSCVHAVPNFTCLLQLRCSPNSPILSCCPSFPSSPLLAPHPARPAHRPPPRLRLRHAHFTHLTSPQRLVPRSCPPALPASAFLAVLGKPRHSSVALVCLRLALRPLPACEGTREDHPRRRRRHRTYVTKTIPAKTTTDGPFYPCPSLYPRP